jgi:hypothetical protein
MKFRADVLECWMREFYFDVEGSGVEDFALGEQSDRAGLSWQALRDLVLRDSRTLGDTALREAIGCGLRKWPMRFGNSFG